MSEEVLDDAIQKLKESRELYIKASIDDLTLSCLNRQLLGRIIQLLSEAVDLSRRLKEVTG